MTGFRNPDIETRFLGAVLVDGLARLDFAPTLTPNDFSGIRRAIFDLIRQHNDDSSFVDPVVMHTELQNAGHDIPLQDVFSIYDAGMGYVDAKACAETLQELRTQRQILNLASKLSQIAHNPDIPGEARREAVYHALFSLESGRNGDGLRSMEQISSAVYDDIEANRRGMVTTTATGYSELDKFLGGWKHGGMYTIGARTGQGKTAMLLNCAAKALVSGPVLFFSLEMSSKDLFKRLVVTRSDVPLEHLANDNVPEPHLQSVISAMGELSEFPMWVDDTPALDLPTLRARAQRFKLQHTDTALICVDYVQLCQLGERVGSRYLEVGRVATGLKHLARELGVPVLAAAQLNRSADARADKTPQLSDLRESGNIEQDSDAVLLLHRLPGAGRMIPTDLIIAKNRHGPTGRTEILFDTKTVSFVQKAGG
jgi:replicative DNA helicase